MPKYTLERATVARYLVERGLLPSGSTEVESLSGGVSNDVLSVSAGGVELVVKQALPRLRVAEEWLATPDRASREARALELAATICPGAVPAVVQLDGDSHLLVMTRAAGAARTWKADLLAGHVDDEVAASVGSLIGRWHAATFGDLHAEEAFGDLEAFVQLRVDPFHRTLAGRHPALAGRIEDLAGALLDDGRRCCLVHGDLSPKNVLVGASDASVWVIDWEVAHFGNPVFDLAFTLCHLGCKAAHRPADASRLAGTSTRFLDSYAEAAPALRARIPDGELVAHTACLMLARVDGKSPAEYLDEGERDAVRSLATHLLRSSDLGLDAIFHA